MSKIKSLKYLVIGFFILNLIIKLINIQTTPPGFTFDEVIYIGEAQSIVEFSSDLKGDWRPWHLEPSDPYYTELTSTVLTPGFILFPNNPILASKFVPLLLGSLLPVLLGLIAYKLKSRKSIFIFTTLFATLNPWVFQFSRMGYDSLFSISFYSLGFVGLLYLKNWNRLWTLIPFFLGFYQYQGHKVLLLPLVGIIFLYIYFEEYKLFDVFKKFKKIIRDKNILSSLTVLLFSLFLTAVYLIRLPSLSSGQRISEFSFYDETKIVETVNTQRRLAFDSKLTPIFINKYTVLSKDFVERLFNSFNLKYLFIEGFKPVDSFTVFDYGFFHIIDSLLIVVGLAYVLKKSKDNKVLIFLISFILIGALPNGIRTGSPWITFRGSFVFLGLLLIMGIGIGTFYDQIKSKYKLILVLLYLILTTQFYYLYFVRYPITHTNYHGFYERIIASYLKRVGDNPKAIIIPDRADATFNYMITYNKLLTKESHEQVSSAARSGHYEINNIKMYGGCPTNIADISTDTSIFVYLFKEPCVPNQNLETKTEIKSLIDSGTIFTVYNDNLCSQYNLGRYPNIKKNIMNVEKLSDQEFCESFFSK